MRHPTTKKQQHWANILEQAEQSGESLADFARTNNLKAQTLYQWRSKLKQSASNESKLNAQHFTRVVAPTSLPTCAVVSIELKGVSLRFEHLPEAHWVSALIDLQSHES